VRSLLFAFLWFPNILNAQTVNITAGIELPLFFKMNIFSHGSAISPIGLLGLTGALRIDGIEDNALSLRQRLGINYDRVSYKLLSGNHLIIERLQLDINPEVLIPGKNPSIKYIAGIGVDCKLDNNVALSSYNFPGGSYIDLDSVYSQVQNGYSIIPFVDFGVLYEWNRHISFQLVLKQTLLNCFLQDAKISYQINNENKTLNLSYRPTLFGIGINYWF